MRRRLSALLAVSLGLSEAAADSGTEAADREFQAAHREFKAGEYESALRHYEAAYRLAPHPNTLYNLALTHERLLQYDAAIDAFQRYLASPPAQEPEAQRTEKPLRLLAERSLRRLRSLPAQISVSASPERVNVSVRPRLSDGTLGAPRWEGPTPAVFTLPAGRYLLRLRKDGYFDEEVSIEPRVGQALLVQRHLRFRPRPLSVVSLPPARIYLDDRLLGQTPYVGSVEVGTHRLRLERRFHLPYQVQFTVTPTPAPLRYRVPLVQNGRYELLLGASLAGAGVGLVVLRTIRGNVERLDEKDAYQALLASLVPAAVGAGLVLLGVDRIPASSAQMILGNATWGTFMGLGLGFGIDPDPDAESHIPHWLAVGGGVLGATIALGIDRRLHPGSGTVALYNSGGMWGATLGWLTWAYLLTHGLSGPFLGTVPGASPEVGHGGWALLCGTAAGVGVGAALASLKSLAHLSRQQVALIDLGGLLGGLGAGGLGFGIAYGVSESWQGAGRVGTLSAIGGAAAGLLTAALLTKGRLDEAPPRQAALQLQTPSISLTPHAGGVAGELTLLRGLW